MPAIRGEFVMSPQVLDAAQLRATEHVQVVIVGAGACGLTAALTLYRLGVACVVLERDAVPSGSTALSSGFIPAPGTHVQRAMGIVDSPQRFAQDIQAKAKGTAAAVPLALACISWAKRCGLSTMPMAL